jgi:hypothetical protein
MLPLYAFMLDTRDHLCVTTASGEAMDQANLGNWRPS